MAVQASGEATPGSGGPGVTTAEPFVLRVGPWVAGGLIFLLRHTMTWTSEGEEIVAALHDASRPYVHAFYHDQLLMMTYSYLGQSHGRRLVVLSSRHRDGEYVARTLELFGHRMVRGSTGRGGAGGLRELIRALRQGNDVAIAVDGPRGPRHRVQPGVIEAARLGEAPIVPVAFAASRVRTLRSWDAFQIPCPLSRGAFVYGDPISVAAGSDRSKAEASRGVLQDRLDHLTLRARALAQGASGTDALQVGGQPGTSNTSSPERTR